MKIKEVISFLESYASPSLQEHYDNAGLLTGDDAWECTGVLCSLDAIEEVVDESIRKKCNLIIAHHPIIFGGLKKINPKNYIGKTIIKAIKHDIAIYAIHTNLDNVLPGVSGKMATMLGLRDLSILSPKEGTLKKLFTFVPKANAEQLRNALFNAGAGSVGNYTECSFNAEGDGTFKAGEGASPYVGEIGKQHVEHEIKIEVIFPSFLEMDVIKALIDSHPYEEPAYDLVQLTNTRRDIGSGVIGKFPEPLNENDFLSLLKKVFLVPVVRHTQLAGRPIQKVAVCGGAGSFLISKALMSKVDAYITSDIKYHEFFDANNQLLIADVGHYETEQFTINLLQEILAEKFPTFAVLKTEVNTNPTKYFM
jgi:dinuclear metal center YbgI/SA1388 family protein